MMSFLVMPMHPYLRRVEVAGERVMRCIDNSRLLIRVCKAVKAVEVVYNDGTVSGGLVVRV
jgi:hypothetical protein